MRLGKGRDRVGLARQAWQIGVGQSHWTVALVATVGDLGSSPFHRNAVDRIVGKLAFHAVLQAVSKTLHDHEDEDAKGHADAREGRAQGVGQHIVGHFQPRVAVKHGLGIQPSHLEDEWCVRMLQQSPPHASPQPSSCLRH